MERRPKRLAILEREVERDRRPNRALPLDPLDLVEPLDFLDDFDPFDTLDPREVWDRLEERDP